MSSGINIGFIGAGKMALALAKGLKKNPAINTIMASCPIEYSITASGHVKDIINAGCHITNCNEELVRTSDAIILAVKPTVVSSVLKEVRKDLNKNKLLISIAAGLKLNSLKSFVNADVKMARVMPNTPSLVGEGVTVYSVGENCSTEDEKTVVSMFSSVGKECHHIDEKLMDAVTGISGSGPAYMFLIIEAMADAGVKQGLPRELAYRLAAQTMVGAGRMVLDTGKHPAVLKDDVCSPGGSTIAALYQLEAHSMRKCIMAAVDAAVDRCKELGKSDESQVFKP